MKTFLIILLLSLCAISSIAGESSGHHKKKYTVTEQTEDFTVYGDPWPHEKASSTPVDQAIEHKKLNTTDVFSGEITQVCQKSGCWMILTQEGTFARVDFDNHRFFIPKDSTGIAHVYGKMKTKKLSKKQKKHLRSDGADITEDEVYEIVADSVKIYAQQGSE